MEADESMQLAEELLAAFNAHDVERIASLLSDTFLVTSPEGPVGPYGWKAQTSEYFRSFPDSAWTKVRLSRAGERFVLEVEWTGTQMVPPTKRQLKTIVTLTGLVRRGKLETLRLDYDLDAIGRQLDLGSSEGAADGGSPAPDPRLPASPPWTDRSPRQQNGGP